MKEMTWARRLGVLLAMGWMGAGGVAHAAADEPTRHFQLANGLRVTLVVDRQAEAVAYHLRLPWGSADDPPGAEGISAVAANLFPKLSTRHIRNEGRRPLAHAMGVPGWVVTVNQQRETTSISTVAASEGLDLLLWSESDRLGFASDGATSEALPAARTLPARETTPAVEVDDVADEVWAGREPLVAPSKPFIDALRPASVRGWLREMAVVSGAQLVLLGAFDLDRAEALTRRYFGALPAGRPARRARSREKTSREGRTAPLVVRGEEGTAALLWESPGYFEAGDSALDVAASVLSVRLRAKLPLKTNWISARQASSCRASAFRVLVHAKAPAELAQMEAVIVDEAKRLAASAPAPEEFAWARDVRTRTASVAYESIADRASLVASAMQCTGDVGRARAYVGSYGALTAEDVRRAMEQVVARAPLIVHGSPSVTGAPPRKTARFNDETRWAALPKASLWDRAPRPAAPPPSVDPIVERGKLANETRIIVAPRSDLPISTFGISVHLAEPACCGAGAVLPSVLASTRPAGSTRPLRAAINQLGGTLAALFASDGYQLRVTVPSVHLRQALESVAEVVAQATPDQSALTTARESVKSWRARPPADAAVGALNPWTRASAPLDRWLLRLDPGPQVASDAEVLKLLGRSRSGAQLDVAVIGPTSAVEVDSWLTPSLGALPRRGEGAAVSSPLARAKSALIDDPSLDRTHVVVAFPMSDDPLTTALMVEALSTWPELPPSLYQAYERAAVADWRDATTGHCGRWICHSVNVPPDMAPKIVDATLDVVSRLRAGNVSDTDARVLRAKLRAWRVGTRTQENQLLQLIGELSSDGASRAPTSDDVRHVTRARVIASARQMLDPQALRVAAVGPVGPLADRLEALGLGNVWRWTAAQGAKP